MSFLVDKIIFVQYFHNGDLFSSKEYVRQITQELNGVSFEYWHFNHEKVLRDLQLPIGNLPSTLGKNGKRMPITFIKDNKFFINTWIESFYRYNVQLPIEHLHGINHYKLSAQWEYIFNLLNKFYGTNLKIKKLDEYVPDIDFSFFHTDNINLEKGNRKRILISNGEVKSNQSFSGNMNHIVVKVAKQFPDIDFFCTSKFFTDLSNVYFTDDVIPDTQEYYPSYSDWSRKKCDLNEISYFSQSCDVIIGRNSGPFIFCLTKNNVFNPDKTFITFNKFQDDSLLRDINHQCKYIWSNDYKEENMINLISKYL